VGISRYKLLIAPFVFMMGKTTYLFVFLIIGSVCFSQHTTINKKEETKSPAKHKIMLVPFEPRMYMSEIDMYINKETKQTAKQIKYAFRDGINEQLYKAFKSSHSVVDLLDDTVKTKKDLENIYQYLGYEFQKVPDQANYKPPVLEKDPKSIDKGQLNVETKGDARFMNARIRNATLIPYLYGKYKSDVFVFVNQLDIKGSVSNGPAELTAGGFRKIVVHYTVYTFDAKEINSGIAEIEFPTALNNPNKIISTYFSKIAQLISQRVNLALNPPAKPK